MQPTDLKAIARDAALRGDTKTLFHTLDLLERLLPIAAFTWTFAPNLRNSACRGRAHGRTETFGTASFVVRPEPGAGEVRFCSRKRAVKRT